MHLAYLEKQKGKIEICLSPPSEMYEIERKTPISFDIISILEFKYIIYVLYIYEKKEFALSIQMTRPIPQRKTNKPLIDLITIRTFCILKCIVKRYSFFLI